MKFLQRVVHGGGPQQHRHHQCLESDDETSLQRKPSDEDSRTISSAETPIGIPWGGGGQPPLDDANQHDSSFLSSNNNSNAENPKEPVWKRRARAYQASLPRREMHSTSDEIIHETTKEAFEEQQEQLSSFPPKNTEINPFDSIRKTRGDRTAGPIDLDATDDTMGTYQNATKEGLVVDDDIVNTSQQTYSHELNDADFVPSMIQDNSILHSTATTNDETTQTETGAEKERTSSSSNKMSGLMEKMMDPSFRKSVMAGKNKAWKTVLACHRPTLQKKMPFPDDYDDEDDEGITKSGAKSSELPFWKRIEKNLFSSSSSSSKEPQEAETSFESTSSTGSKELLIFLKRAGTSLTGFVKETTAACTQPPHEDDEDVSFDDGSTLDSRTVSKASTTNNINNDDRRLWREFFEDENYSLGDDATANPEIVGGCQTLPDSLKNAVSII